jgi:UDP-N-acetylglucosamine 2-epimerase
VLSAFGVNPDHDLDLMQPGQSLFQSTSRILARLEPVLDQERPDIVVVQGDTTTTLCGGLAAFYRQVPVAHVEAGLRTRDMRQPFPEEMNRVVTTHLSSLHFAPTEVSAQNLLREGVDRSAIFVTGNTGIDAVLYIRDQLDSGAVESPEWPWLDPEKKLILVTAHRRESFGAGFDGICEGVRRLATRPDVLIAYPVHPNPNVTDPVFAKLSGLARIHLIEPLNYVPFVDLMRRAWLLLTDSGGIQEEAPSLGKPVLVMREKTERPEAVEAGTVLLVGTDPDRIEGQAAILLDCEEQYRAMSRVHNPYGDGHASVRILEATRSFLKV